MGMLMKTLLLSFILIISFQTFPQTQIEGDINIAYQNAKKGIYWSLSNVPENKLRLKHDLIDKDKLYSTVQIVKEIDGVKIVSTGYNNSTEVRIKMYRSFKSLIKEGYIETKKENDQPDTTKQVKKKSRKES
jgi:hypothetical protein